MTNPETNARLETLEAHVAKLEAIVDVLLEQIAAGTVEEIGSVPGRAEDADRPKRLQPRHTATGRSRYRKGLGA